jgi:pimeloyl-ACP methyl ester carboxylesterase
MNHTGYYSSYNSVSKTIWRYVMKKNLSMLLALLITMEVLLGCATQPQTSAPQTEPVTGVEEREKEAVVQSVFKHPRAEAAYVAAYNTVLEAWPVPYETRYVPTKYGDAHMIISGPEDGEPLILIPGSITDATIWSGSIAAFTRTYRVFALDTMGDVGKNKMVEPLPDPAGAAEWLTQVLDALEIEKAFMVGYSQGGFFTANYAIHNPERLTKIVLLAPAATLAPFGKNFVFGAMLPAMVAGLANNVYEARLGGAYAIQWSRENYFRVSQEGLAAEIAKDKDLADLMVIFGEESLWEFEARIDSILKGSIRNQFVSEDLIGFREFDLYFLSTKYKDPMSMKFGPYPFPDEALKMIKTPTLLLMGDHEILYLGGPDQAIKRAEALVENIQTILIPYTSHMLLWE